MTVSSTGPFGGSVQRWGVQRRMQRRCTGTRPYGAALCLLVLLYGCSGMPFWALLKPSLKTGWGFSVIWVCGCFRYGAGRQVDLL